MWTPKTQGLYALTARAYDTYNNATTSIPVVVGINTVVPVYTFVLAPVVNPAVPSTPTIPGCPTGFTCTLKPNVTTPSATPNCQTTASTPASPLGYAGQAFTRSLTIGSTGSDVKALQIFLNSHGFTVSTYGNGSSGHETTYYGPATASAVSRFQNAYAALILTPSGLTHSTGYFGPATIKEANLLSVSTRSGVCLTPTALTR